MLALSSFQEKILRRIDQMPSAGQWLQQKESLLDRAVQNATFRIEATLEANRQQVEGFHAVLREFIDRVVKLEQCVPVKAEWKPAMRRKKR